jgi:hypothetical protein
MCSLQKRTTIKEENTQYQFHWPPPFPSQKTTLSKKQEKDVREAERATNDGFARISPSNL